MSKKDIKQKPSETALMAALHRAIAYKEFGSQRLGSDNLAEYFLPSHFKFFIGFKIIRANSKNKLNKVLPGMHEYVIARTAFFDSLFIEALNSRIPQIVLLGAGYDSRAYRFAKLNTATKIFELDIATTQNRKMKSLIKARIDIPKNVELVPIDFNNESLHKVLEKAGYNRHERTLFLWEGVVYYLDPESVDATLEFVNRSSLQGSIIALDYLISNSESNRDEYGNIEFFQAMKKHHSNEKLMFSIDEGEAESFFGQRGLKMIDHWDNEEIERTFLLNKDGLISGKIIGSFRFALASPRHKEKEMLINQKQN
jgi:methyltransferase (TIGR00027 family)